MDLTSETANTRNNQRRGKRPESEASARNESDEEATKKRKEGHESKSKKSNEGGPGATAKRRTTRQPTPWKRDGLDAITATTDRGDAAK
jgi:hypothetical protein